MDGAGGLSRLYRDYQRALGDRRFRARDLDYARLDYHVPLLERLDAVEDSSVAVYDLNRRKYVFLTGSFKFLLGYRREDALDQGPEFFYQRMHPDDLPVVLDTVARALRFLDGLPSAARKDYRLSFDFRIRRADEKMVRLLQQIVVLELDRRGNIWLILAVNDLVHNGARDATATRNLRHLRTGKYFLFVPPTEAPTAEAGVHLSPREIEVLGLVAVGLASREIADRLCISVATVNNHRQHVLEKTGARTSAEAVRYATVLGLIGGEPATRPWTPTRTA